MDPQNNLVQQNTSLQNSLIQKQTYFARKLKTILWLYLGLIPLGIIFAIILATGAIMFAFLTLIILLSVGCGIAIIVISIIILAHIKEAPNNASGLLIATSICTILIIIPFVDFFAFIASVVLCFVSLSTLKKSYN